jgi:hypothetical protein
VSEDNKIVGAVEDTHYTLEQAKKVLKQENVIHSLYGYNLGEAERFLRVRNEEIVLKPTAILSTSKDKIRADGIDEVTIYVEVVDLQPEEEITEVVLDINKAKVTMNLENSKGEMIFSTDSTGVIVISVVENGILSSRAAVMAR